jgi:(p)ppGpp synthase/HD superfamily hydrolase
MLAAMQPRERARLADAIRFALDAHAEQTRKGSEAPYSSHPLQVAGMVLEHGGDAALAMAGALHDVLEDCASVERGQLAERFGDEVARIVESCSDLLPGDRPDAKSDWVLRKRAYLERLGGEDARTRLVAACDKLHNLRCLVGDLRVAGTSSLSRFRASPEQTRWYFEAVRASLCHGLPPRLLDELDRLLALLRGFLPAPAEPQGPAPSG